MIPLASARAPLRIYQSAPADHCGRGMRPAGDSGLGGSRPTLPLLDGTRRTAAAPLTGEGPLGVRGGATGGGSADRPPPPEVAAALPAASGRSSSNLRCGVLSTTLLTCAGCARSKGVRLEDETAWTMVAEGTDGWTCTWPH